MDDEDERRLAANEALFRQVNESINRGRWPGDDGAIGFRCECAEIGCNSLVSLTPREYEDVRSHPRWFLMVPGHEIRHIESVVERRRGYVVVEKRDAAAAVAEASDPRS